MNECHFDRLGIFVHGPQGTRTLYRDWSELSDHDTTRDERLVVSIDVVAILPVSSTVSISPTRHGPYSFDFDIHQRVMSEKCYG
jgi:hypothetical protein